MSDSGNCTGSDPNRSEEPLLDIGHLQYMTLGDRALEREVLELFDRQTAMMAEQLAHASASVVASCAHTLKGSARGVGAWRLAQTAEQAERFASAGESGFSASLLRLIEAVNETRRAIGKRLELG